MVYYTLKAESLPLGALFTNPCFCMIGPLSLLIDVLILTPALYPSSTVYYTVLSHRRPILTSHPKVPVEQSM